MTPHQQFKKIYGDCAFKNTEVIIGNTEGMQSSSNGEPSPTIIHYVGYILNTRTRNYDMTFYNPIHIKEADYIKDKLYFVLRALVLDLR